MFPGAIYHHIAILVYILHEFSTMMTNSIVMIKSMDHKA